MPGFDAITDGGLTDGIIGRRVLASIADGLGIGLALGGLHALFWLLGFLSFGLFWFLATGLWVVPIAYVWLWVASDTQATPGQMLLGLCVARDADLGRPTPAQALVYAVAYAVSLWLGAVWLAVALFTRRFRCLHDIAAGLVVVRRDALTAAPNGLNMMFGSSPT